VAFNHQQVEIFRWLYESSVLREKWTYAEVIGEMLLLQFAFIYTTAYVCMYTLSHVLSADHPKGIVRCPCRASPSP
jgi:hypothetical protein